MQVDVHLPSSFTELYLVGIPAELTKPNPPLLKNTMTQTTHTNVRLFRGHSHNNQQHTVGLSLQLVNVQNVTNRDVTQQNQHTGGASV